MVSPGTPCWTLGEIVPAKSAPRNADVDVGPGITKGGSK